MEPHAEARLIYHYVSCAVLLVLNALLLVGQVHADALLSRQGEPVAGDAIRPGLVDRAERVTPSSSLDSRDCEEIATTTGDRIMLAQQGCCSSHGGVCGCGGDGRTLCCDTTVSPTCHCTPPPPHTLTITSGPSGSPNPVASGGTAGLSVTAVDSLGHSLSYSWGASCSGLPSNGSFSNPNTRTPSWTAPPNATGAQRACTIQVSVTDGTLNDNGSFGENVNSTAPGTQCGEERWSVKTGTDPDAHLVNLGAVTPTSIGAMRSLVAPPSLPEDNRIAPVETTVWMLDGVLTLYKEEDDSDYHLTVRDEAGNTMITEIPLPTCVGPGSPFADGIARARSEFDSHLTATGSFTMANVPVRVTGVGFFDFLHGQTGVAPNGIELHPVLDVVFNPTPNAGQVASVLPASRSVLVGTTASAFATVINTGSSLATGCGISLGMTLPATLKFQTTDPVTNQLTGTENTPVDIPGGGRQSFVFALTPSAPISPTDVPLNFACNNTAAAPIFPGLNTLLFSASATPPPDVVALAATLSHDGIVNVPGVTGTGVFVVATVNVGASGQITVSADTGAAALATVSASPVSAPLSVNISLCQTDPASSICLAPPTSSVTTQINAGQTPTFAIFVAGTGTVVPFDPANNRIFVRFKDAGGVTRGATSVAVRTQ